MTVEERLVPVTPIYAFVLRAVLVSSVPMIAFTLILLIVAEPISNAMNVNDDSIPARPDHDAFLRAVGSSGAGLSSGARISVHPSLARPTCRSATVGLRGGDGEEEHDARRYCVVVIRRMMDSTGSIRTP